MFRNIANVHYSFVKKGVQPPWLNNSLKYMKSSVTHFKSAMASDIKWFVALFCHWQYAYIDIWYFQIIVSWMNFKICIPRYQTVPSDYSVAFVLPRHQLKVK